MVIEYRQRRARSEAAKIIRQYGIDAPEHIRLEDIAWDLEAEIVHGDLSGASARLSRLKNRARIRVSDRVDNVGHQRFSVAHELGHLVLGHTTTLQFCSEADLHDFGGKSTVEAEANAFASELLLPEHLVRRRCEVSPVDLKVVRAIANDFSTSVTATTKRFIQLTSEKCAMFYSRTCKVEWFEKTSDFWPFVLGNGAPLSKWSLAHDYFTNGKLPDWSETVDASAWVADEDSLHGLEEIYEHSMAIPSLEAVISLLWIPHQ